jgi:SAM-dependent methyltransferase
VLPFGGGAFDLTICIDAVIHLADRVAAVADWARVLRKSGRLLFTDAAVLTGAVSKEEIDKRASQGAFTIARPGANENAIASAGLILLRREDKTEATANVALRWFDVRERFAVDLKNEEGEEFFARRQIFLATTAELAASRRLSRFLYVAEKRA